MQRNTYVTGVLAALAATIMLSAAPAGAAAQGHPQPAISRVGLIGPGAGYGEAHGSAHVQALQRQLVRVGEHPGPIDGRFGPLTASAVRAFQQRQGLAVDGIVGPITEAALRRQPTTLAPGTGYGEPHGSGRVRELQRQLVRVGEHPGPIDGRFGPLTASAVRAFQQRQGLAVDGIVGKQTEAGLKRLLAARNERSGGAGHRAVRGERASAAGPRGEQAKFQKKPTRTEAPKATSTPVDHGQRSAPVNRGGPNRHRGGPESGPALWLVALAVIATLLALGALAVILRQRAARSRQADMPGPDAPLFQIRIIGREGQGVVTTAELLSVAAMVEDRHAQAFPVFADDRGGVVMSLCRIGDREIRPREPIALPDALIVQDPGILPPISLLEWLEPEGYLVVNSRRGFEELGLDEGAASLRKERRVKVPTTGLAPRHPGRAVPNTVLLGAFAGLCGVVSFDSLAVAIRERFPGPIGDANVAAAEAGFEYAQNGGRALAPKERTRMPMT